MQGVGFRPFVYRLARELRLGGWVQNRPEGIRIEVQGPASAQEDFLHRLLSEAPRAAAITAIRSEVLPEVEAAPFEILTSESRGDRLPSIPADLAICPDCEREILDPKARRFRYPFTNCTACGPRYSIIAALPYDRPRTAMAAFPLCPECRREFENPRDRRFHAQPVACPRCGPRLGFSGPGGELEAEAGEALAAGVALLQRGGILALKGLGGFQFLVDAGSQPAVQWLRDRKGRAEKPFAVMFPDRAALGPPARWTPPPWSCSKAPPPPSCCYPGAKAPP